MTQADMERELSAATGESVGTIRHRGFQLIEPLTTYPRTVDWDSLNEDRVAVLPQRTRSRRRAA